MNVGELIKLYRSVVLYDTVEPYLWEDAELIDYLSQAQLAYCSEVSYIYDSMTPSICVYQVPAGALRVKLSPLIQEVRTARLAAPGVDPEVNSTTLTPYNPLGPLPSVIDAYADNSGTHLVSSNKYTRYYSMGETDGYLKLHPKAAQDCVLYLSVTRAPRELVCDKSAELEVPQRHARELFHYMSYLAYMKNDRQTLDMNASARSYSEWLNSVDRCRTDTQRRRNQRRTVRYGGY